MTPSVRLTPAGPGRHIVNNNVGNGNGGISICCCRICTCINVGFLSTRTGLLKLVEVMVGSLCQTLLIQYGLPYATDIGQAFTGCLTTVASCLTTTSILLFCYIVSTRTYQLVRQSLFVSIISLLLMLIYSFIWFYIIYDTGSDFQFGFVLLPLQRLLIYGLHG